MCRNNVGDIATQPIPLGLVHLDTAYFFNQNKIQKFQLHCKMASKLGGHLNNGRTVLSVDHQVRFFLF